MREWTRGVENGMEVSRNGIKSAKGRKNEKNDC